MLALVTVVANMVRLLCTLEKSWRVTTMLLLIWSFFVFFYGHTVSAAAAAVAG